MKSVRRREFNFYKATILLALPVMIQQLVTALGSLVDNLMVGQLNSAAIAAVGASNQIFLIVMCLGYGIAEGISIFIAQQFGAKKYSKMHHTFCVAIILAVITSLLAITVVSLNKIRLLNLFNLEADGISYGIDYLSIIVISYIFILLNISIGTVFRATSRTKIPMFAGIVAIIINTSLNFLLINGNLGFPALEVRGAAIATVTARMIEFIILLIILLRLKPEFLPKLKDFLTIPLDLFIKIIKKTIPLIFNEALWSLGMTTIAIFYATRGEDTYAAITISQTIANLLYVTMSGFAVSVSIQIGQKLGRNLLNQAKRDAFRLLRLSYIVGFSITILAIILSTFVPDFYKVDEQVRIMAGQILRVTGVFFPIYISTATLFFILRAGGDTTGVIIMDSLYMWVVTVPIAALLTFTTDISILYLYIGVQCFDLLKLLIAYLRFSKYKWLRNLNQH